MARGALDLVAGLGMGQAPTISQRGPSNRNLEGRDISEYHLAEVVFVSKGFDSFKGPWGVHFSHMVRFLKESPPKGPST